MIDVNGTSGKDKRECIVLLHGVGMNAVVMRRLQGALTKAGYRTVNLSYPSRVASFEKIAEEFLPGKLLEHDVARAPKLHFVCHSMGSLLVRLLFAGKNRPKNLGRTVMLGPPNHGSAAADFASESKMLRRIVGVNLPALGTGAVAITKRLGAADFEVGVIAGISKLNPIFRSVLTTANDGAVTLESAKLEGMSDFIVVPHSHTAMLWRDAVIRQVLVFLQTGHFAHEANRTNR